MKLLPLSLCLVLAPMVFLAACDGKKQALHIQTERTAFQSVNVNTPGVTGANCVVQSGDNTYTVKAPGAVMVRRAPDIMNVSCFKGDHMRGQASFRPVFAPGEAEGVRGTQGVCLTCNYPGTVTVAMALNKGSMEIPYMVWPQ